MARLGGEVRERNALIHRDAGRGKVRSLTAILEASRAARDRETLACGGATTSNGGALLRLMGGYPHSQDRRGRRGEIYPGSSGSRTLDAPGVAGSPDR